MYYLAMVGTVMAAKSIHHTKIRQSYVLIRPTAELEQDLLSITKPNSINLYSLVSLRLCIPLS